MRTNIFTTNVSGSERRRPISGLGVEGVSREGERVEVMSAKTS
jgi:hypothetical protein